MPAYCKSALSLGRCPQEGLGCKLSHNVKRCDVCCIFSKPTSWGSHVNGKKHRKNIQKATNTGPVGTATQKPPTLVSKDSSTPAPSSNSPVPCDVCGIVFLDANGFKNHQKTKHHRMMKEKPPRSNMPDDHFHCVYCNINIRNDLVHIHNNTVKHIRRKRAFDLHAASVQMQEDSSCPLLLPDIVDFDVIDPEGIQLKKVSRLIDISTVGVQDRLSLKEFRIKPRIGSSLANFGKFSTVLRSSKHNRDVYNGHPLKLEIVFTPTSVGLHEEILELTFHDQKTSRVIILERNLRAMVCSTSDYELLRSSGPYRRKRHMAPVAPDKIHPGKRPVVWSSIRFKKKLLQYPVPKNLVKAVSDKFLEKSNINQDEFKEEFMPGLFSMSTYSKHFRVMLHIEEVYEKLELAKLGLDNQELTSAYPYYSFKYKASEVRRKRKVLVGDTLLFRQINRDDDKWYQGVVHRLLDGAILLRFDSGFNIYKGNRFNIQFTINRLPFRRKHEAVSDISIHKRLLFPEATEKCYRTLSKSLWFFNRIIKSNDAQKDVIETIMSMLPGCTPLLVYGPPGTGKTSTIVEAIQQLVHQANEKHIRVLACAPSNRAADVIASRLKAMGATSILRLCALVRDYTEVPEDIRDLCCVNTDYFFNFPPLEELEEYDVIVCTCVSSGVLSGLGIPRGHFDFIFIDEAGQATEPESMVPIKALADRYTNVVLCGDKKQLGPIVKSPFAKALGLHQSYFERLMNQPNSSGAIIKTLVNHYRSHESIIDFSNKEFYENVLKICGDPAITHSLLGCDVLVSKSFPIVFHGVSGMDDREGDSPSYFNIVEASLVKKYVTELMKDRKVCLQPEDIGIISPYNAQCSKIAKLLEVEWPGIKVGNVEEYQGQERRVIILSSVRSNMEYLKSDLRRSIGFLADLRRFNVAITRARALLIVIGDPVILSLDPIWRQFLSYIYIHGGWKGEEIDWDPRAEVTENDFTDEKRASASEEVRQFIGRMTSNTFENYGEFEGGYMDRASRMDDI